MVIMIEIVRAGSLANVLDKASVYGNLTLNVLVKFFVQQDKTILFVSMNRGIIENGLVNKLHCFPHVLVGCSLQSCCLCVAQCKGFSLVAVL